MCMPSEDFWEMLRKIRAGLRDRNYDVSRVNGRELLEVLVDIDPRFGGNYPQEFLTLNFPSASTRPKQNYDQQYNLFVQWIKWLDTRIKDLQNDSSDTHR